MPNELIHLRIGAWVIHPDAMILPVAGLVFAVLAHRALYPAVFHSRGTVALFILLIGIGAVLGARLYGLIWPLYNNEDVIANGAWRDLRFGSMGGVWGILLVSLVFSRIFMAGRVFAILDSTIPSICISAAVARVSCVFQGCCAGIDHGPLAALSNPVYSWPILDIAALSLTLILSDRVRNLLPHAGIQTFIFLVAYGGLRFVIEMLRDTYTAVPFMTWGQVLSLVQVFVGVCVLFLLQSQRHDNELKRLANQEIPRRERILGKDISELNRPLISMQAISVEADE